MIHPDTGRVHTHYSQAVAVTGRLASSDPNLQNIPVRTEEGRRVRKAFIARPAGRLCRRITRRSNCASWRTCPTTRACCKPLPTAKTSTAPPPPKCLPCRWPKSAASNAAMPKPSTLA